MMLSKVLTRGRDIRNEEQQVRWAKTCPRERIIRKNTRKAKTKIWKKGIQFMKIK
jgi:hypothetical protein